MARISTIGAYDNSDLEAQILKLEEKIEGIPDDIATTFQEIEDKIESTDSNVYQLDQKITALIERDVLTVDTTFDDTTRVLTTKLGLIGGGVLSDTVTIPGGSGGSYTAGDGIQISDANAISAAVDGSSVVLTDGKIAAAPIGVTAPLKKDTTLDISLLYDADTLNVNANGELAVKDPAVAYTGGDGITVADAVIKANVDGSTIKAVDGVLQAVIPEYTGGSGISIAGTTVAAVYDDTTIKVNSNGQLYAVGGGSGGDYTAGQGITITDQEIKASIDGSTITFNDSGQMVAAGGTEYTAGQGIAISNGKIFVKIDDMSIKPDSSGYLYVNHGYGLTDALAVDVDNSTIDFDANGKLEVAWQIGNGLKLDSGILYTDVDDSTIKWNDSGQLVAQYPTYSAGSAISIDSANQIGVMTDGTTIKLNDSGQLYAVSGGSSGGSPGYQALNQYSWQSITDWAVGDIVILADEGTISSSVLATTLAIVTALNSSTSLELRIIGGQLGSSGAGSSSAPFEIKFPAGTTTMAANTVSVNGLVIGYSGSAMYMYGASWTMYPVGRLPRISS